MIMRFKILIIKFAFGYWHRMLGVLLQQLSLLLGKLSFGGAELDLLIKFQFMVIELLVGFENVTLLGHFDDKVVDVPDLRQ